MATQMLVDGDDRTEVVAVAAMSYGTLQADGIGPVFRLLAVSGIPTVSASASEMDRCQLLKEAFAHNGASIEQFEGPWYAQLPAYDEQTEEQRAVTQLLDLRDQEGEPLKRAEIAEEIRDLLRG